jgi:ABC-2 type transport system permease protein
MTPYKNWISYSTLVRKEVIRFLRVWSQTLLPPVVTMTLYFVIFGKFIGSQIGDISGYSYMQFIVPGLVMMAVIMQSFMNTVSSYYFAKFQKSIEEIIVSPTPYPIVIAGYISGGVIRGMLTGMLVLTTALFFTQLHIAHIGITLLFALLTSILFSLVGLINGVYAKSFDGISIIPNFVLTPLTYLGGIFYSVSMLPPFWQAVSSFNPILYMIAGFRYGLLGVADVSIAFAASLLITLTVVLFCFVWWLFKTGRGLRA